MKKLLFLLILLTSIVHAKSVAILATFPDNSSLVSCVNVSNQTNAYEALQKTNWNLSFSYNDQYGHALCKIEDTGCPPENCFCSDKYWNFFIHDNNWSYSEVGFDSYNPKNGDLIGLAYGKHGLTPKNVSFAQVCKRKSLPADDSSKLADWLFSPYSLVVVFLALLAFYELISYERDEK